MSEKYKQPTLAYQIKYKILIMTAIYILTSLTALMIFFIFFPCRLYVNIKINKILKKSSKKTKENYLNQFCSTINWIYAKEALLCNLKKTAEQLNKSQDLYLFNAYPFYCDRKGVQQVILKAQLNPLIPRFRVKDSANSCEKRNPSSSEREVSSTLIFTKTNQGITIVTANPHKSSNSEPIKEGPYVLGIYHDNERLRQDAVLNRLYKYTSLYLSLQRASSFYAAPSKKNARLFKKLDAQDAKNTALFSNNREQRVETHRVKWALGVAAASSLFGVSLQSLSSLISNNEANPLAFISTAVLLLVTLSILITLKIQSDK